MRDQAHVRLLDEDQAARERALDVATSFLVQAPAGSGKTELLIQRYLALLARVDEPEQVVALTFTRKAAGEMRERVLKALVEARDQVPVARPYAQLTRALALEVLRRDADRGWAIVEHASRLSMLTFDALAFSLARQAPLSAGLGPWPGYLDDAAPLHRSAAEGAIADAAAGDAQWLALLRHVDNNAMRAAELVAGLLERRDQWLRQVAGTPADALRAGLERALRDEIEEVLGVTRGAFPPGVAAEIERCAVHAAEVLAQSEEHAGFAQALRDCVARGGLPAASIDALPHWRTLARFLMVRDGSHFKRSVETCDGFLAVGKHDGARERRARKEAMKSLCSALEHTPGLARALAAAARLPDPAIGDNAWRVVEATLAILVQAAAKLTTVFAAEGNVDFVQGNLAALAALGDDQSPSDLLLRLDARVQHLLVDEFQDTSFTQLRLLERLTEGWQPGDGRTLFAVGDPMQSIYRFREAEVGLFVAAQASGTIGSLPVETLRLRRNFRSQANVVDWTNAAFSQVLGQVNDPARGAVAFEAAVAAHEAREGVHPTLDVCATADEEASVVVQRIRDAQAAGARDIAVLVRARTHLVDLLPALRHAQIPFAAVELDRLSQRQAVLDLCALTHALLQPADRTAWLALLRAPWCGLALPDLFALVSAAGREQDASLLTALDDAEAWQQLSADGRARLHRALDVLRPALEARGRASVTDRVRGAWLALGGPACFDDPLDLEAARLFFELLSGYEAAGDVPDWQALVAALDSLHASPKSPPAAGVQVMTMHKAKGLEFDTVILPGLAKLARQGDAPLLRWRRRVAGLLIAPGKARGGDNDPLYAWLGSLDREEEDAELGRLLYVACTRAKVRLHLVAAPGVKADRKTGEWKWKDPVRSSSIVKLWDVLAAGTAEARAASVAPTAFEPPRLARLPLAFHAAPADAGIALDSAIADRDTVSPPFDWVRETTRHIGTLAHRLLARIADQGIEAWPESRVTGLAARVQADLACAGFAADELPAATAKVLDAVRRTLSDPRGRWLFDAAHEDARSEWALAGLDGGEIVRVVVDRTFVAAGERWIVDFKTGAHEGGDVQGFLDSEVGRYREQLERYGRLMRGIDARPVRLALYYPLVEGGFREILPLGP
jgi:ATP-dependent exoDNAse (exonuclease V) beta subunit